MALRKHYWCFFKEHGLIWNSGDSTGQILFCSSTQPLSLKPPLASQKQLRVPPHTPRKEEPWPTLLPTMIVFLLSAFGGELGSEREATWNLWCNKRWHLFS